MRGHTENGTTRSCLAFWILQKGIVLHPSETQLRSVALKDDLGTLELVCGTSSISVQRLVLGEVKDIPLQAPLQDLSFVVSPANWTKAQFTTPTWSSENGLSLPPSGSMGSFAS